MSHIVKSVNITTTLVALLKDLGAPYEDNPVEIKAKFDRQGRTRGLVARWANGWHMTVNLHLSGDYSVSYSLRLTTRRKQ